MVVNSKNNRPTMVTRFVVYPLVLVLFLFILSYVLMLAGGYKPTLKDGKVRFVKTSMIIVGTRPGDAKIYLNNNYKKRTTLSFLTVKITGLVPGIYQVKIEKPGYRTWENKLNVVTDLVTWANYVLLFPNQLKFEKIELPKAQELATSRNGRYIIYPSSKDGKFALINYDVSNQNEKNIWPSQGLDSYPWLQNPVIKNASYNLNDDKVLLAVENSGLTEYVTIDIGLSDGRAYIYKPQSDFQTTLESLEWSSLDGNKLIIKTPKGIYISNSAFDTSPQLVLDGEIISSYLVSHNEIIYVQKNQATGINSLNWKNGNNLTVLDSALSSGVNYKIGISFDSKYVSLLNADTKELNVYYSEAGKFKSVLLSNTAKSYFWNKNEDKIAFYSERKVMTFDFVRNHETVFETNSDIKQISWYYDESHFLINDGSLYVIDFDGANKVLIDDQIVTARQDKLTNDILILDAIVGDIKTYKKYISEI